MYWLFTAVQGITLLWLWMRRYPRPWFLLALACWTLQSANVNLGRSAEWLGTWWKYPEMALLLVTVAACVEAEGIGTEYIYRPFQRLQIRVAAISLPTCMVGSAMMAFHPTSFQDYRMWAWWWMGIFLLVSEALMDLRDIPRPVHHSRLLMVVMASHALLSPFLHVDPASWMNLHIVSRALIGACCLMWAISGVIVVSPRSQHGSPGTSAR